MSQDSKSSTENKKKDTPFRRNMKVVLQLLALLIVLPLLGTFLLVVVYKFVPVTNTPFMRDLARKNNVEVTQKWVPLSQISKQLPLAVVSSEDNLFTKHNGFCWSAIEKAYKNNKKGKKVHGASTISQQTAKNVFLWNSRSWARKGFEVVVTVMIEAVWGKERIMEVYLNVVEYGPGLYGAEAASRHFFRHSAKNISSSEAALMAAVMPNPVRMKINAPSPYVLRRQAHIQSLMRKIGKVNYNNN